MRPRAGKQQVPAGLRDTLCWIVKLRVSYCKVQTYPDRLARAMA